MSAAGGPSVDRRAGLRTSGLVLAVAGAVWWLVGATAPADDGVPLWLLLAGVLPAAAAVAVAWAFLDGHGEAELFERNRRMYAVVNVLQVLGIVAVVVVCGRLGLQQWIPVGITAVFAAHFVPFGPAFRWRGWTVLAGALAAVAAGGAVLAASGAAAATVQRSVGVTVALVLWLGVWGAVLSRRRPRAAGATDLP